LEERFWKKVAPSNEDGCREWLGSVRPKDGYGQLGIYTKRGGSHLNGMTHRIAWFLAYGAWPEKGKIIRHLCHNRLCVEVTHLALSTVAENCSDTINLRRHSSYKRRLLSDEEVRLIRSTRRYSDIAKRLGVSVSTVFHARHRLTYRDIE
jgi:DNA-binding CsgD family transcriptional regulator